MASEPDKPWSHFDRTSFEQVHKGILDLIPPTPAAILDVGAGTGRDARALAARGHQVTAVEPSSQLLQEALRRSGPSVVWVNDILPDLEELGERQFDFVLVSAVWMYIDPPVRAAAMQRLASLLTPLGTLVVTTRASLPTDNHEMFYEASREEILAMADAADLIALREGADPDSLERGITWATFVFGRRPN